MRVLQVDDIAQAQRSGAQYDSNHREAERKLIADHLRGRAQRAEKRIFIVRRPTGERDAVDADGGDAENHQQADIQVGDLEHVDAMPANIFAERDHANRDQRAG